MARDRRRGRPGKDKGKDKGEGRAKRGRGALADRLAKKRRGEGDEEPSEPSAAPAADGSEGQEGGKKGRGALAARLAKRARGEGAGGEKGAPAAASSAPQKQPEGRRRRAPEQEKPPAVPRGRPETASARRDKPAGASGRSRGAARQRKPFFLWRLLGWVARLFFPVSAVFIYLYWRNWATRMDPGDFMRLVAVAAVVRCVWNLFNTDRFLEDYRWVARVCGFVWRIAYGVARLVYLRVVERVFLALTWRCRVLLLAGLAGVCTIYLHTHGEDQLLAWSELTGQELAVLEDTGILPAWHFLVGLAGVCGCLQLGAALLGLLRTRVCHLLVKLAAASYVLTWLYLVLFLVQIPGELFRVEAIDYTVRNELWVEGTWLWLPFFLYGLLFLCMVLRAEVTAYYAGKAKRDRELGDAVLRNLRTHGADPRYRTSFYWAGFAHIFVLFVLPFIMQYGCEEEPYGIPKGSGDPIVEMVKIKKPKKKPKKKIVLKMDSAFIYWRPEIDDSEVMEEVDKDTMDTYQATKLQGKLGKGGGKKGGWPNGMSNTRVRFIRLEYNGGDWNQGMGVGSDHNILVQLNKMTGFKIADKTESRPIRQLRKFPPGRAPPFVYITGSGAINISSDDRKTLRWYCLQEGGLLFADNGGGSFDRSLRQLVRRIFPEKKLVAIPNDDVIFQEPFPFPNGAPRLWAHSGGGIAMGIRHQGRWVVFYHQGDIGDAWDDNTGRSIRKGLRLQAFKMGLNVMVYSFNQYQAIHYNQ